MAYEGHACISQNQRICPTKQAKSRVHLNPAEHPNSNTEKHWEKVRTLDERDKGELAKKELNTMTTQ